MAQRMLIYQNAVSLRDMLYRLCKQYDHVIMLPKKYTLRSLRYMWVGLLTDRINNKLERSNLINEHALNREPVPLTKLNALNK